jgi:plasmid stabilization system protein ParE
VIARIVTTADLLAERPLLGPERPDVSAGLRSFVVWPYVIFYQPRGTGARIMRVVHGRQDVGRAFRAPNGDNI